MSDAPNINYQKLFDKFKEINTLEIKDWTKNHVLGYFVKKYKDQYDVDYSFKFNTPAPSKCFEIWQVSALSSKLSAQPHILKEYIDWFFDNVVPKMKKRFISISALTKDDTVNYYKVHVLLADKAQVKIDRLTILPPKFHNIMKEFPMEINTYGDLAFVSQMNPTPAGFDALLNNLVELGFDINILSNIV